MSDADERMRRFIIPEKGFGLGDADRKEDRVDVSPAGTEGCLWVDDFPELDGVPLQDDADKADGGA